MKLREFLNNLSKENAKQLKVTIVGPVASWHPVFTSATNNTKFSADFSKFVNIHVSNDPQDGVSLIELVNNANETGVSLPDNLQSYSDVRQAARNADVLLMATPVDEIVNVCEQLADEIKSNAFALCLTQEMRRNSFGYVELVSETISDILGIPCYTLAGYEERNINSSAEHHEATLGCQNPIHAAILSKLINHNEIKLNVTNDVEAVELCGALKNLIELGAGICNGLHLSDNAKTRIMLEGLNEMIMFFRTFHAERNLVDVFAKCGIPEIFSMEHVNKNMLMAQCFVVSNKPIDQIERELYKGHRLNGVSTADGIYHMLKFHNLEKKFPLFTTIHRVCSNIMKAKDIVDVCSAELDNELESANCNDDIFRVITDKVLKQQNPEGTVVVEEQKNLRSDNTAVAAAAPGTAKGVQRKAAAVNATSSRKFSTLPPKRMLNKNFNLKNAAKLFKASKEQRFHDAADETKIYSNKRYYNTGVEYTDPQPDYAGQTRNHSSNWGFSSVSGGYCSNTFAMPIESTSQQPRIHCSYNYYNQKRDFSFGSDVGGTCDEDEWLKVNKRIVENTVDSPKRKNMSPLTLNNSKHDLTENEINSERCRLTTSTDGEEITMQMETNVHAPSKFRFLSNSGKSRVPNFNSFKISAINSDSTKTTNPNNPSDHSPNTTTTDTMSPEILQSTMRQGEKVSKFRSSCLSPKDIEDIKMRTLSQNRSKNTFGPHHSDGDNSEISPKYKTEVTFSYTADQSGQFGSEGDMLKEKTPKLEFNTEEFQTVAFSSDGENEVRPSGSGTGRRSREELLRDIEETAEKQEEINKIRSEIKKKFKELKELNKMLPETVDSENQTEKTERSNESLRGIEWAQRKKAERKKKLLELLHQGKFRMKQKPRTFEMIAKKNRGKTSRESKSKHSEKVLRPAEKGSRDDMDENEYEQGITVLKPKPRKPGRLIKFQPLKPRKGKTKQPRVPTPKAELNATNSKETQNEPNSTNEQPKGQKDPYLYQMRQREYYEIPKMPQRKLRTFEMISNETMPRGGMFQSYESYEPFTPKTHLNEPTEAKAVSKEMGPAQTNQTHRGKIEHQMNLADEIQIEASDEQLEVKKIETELDQMKHQLTQAKLEMEQMIIKLMESENESRALMNELSQADETPETKKDVKYMVLDTNEADDGLRPIEEMKYTAFDASEMDEEMTQYEMQLKRLENEIAKAIEMDEFGEENTELSTELQQQVAAKPKALQQKAHKSVTDSRAVLQTEAKTNLQDTVADAQNLRQGLFEAATQPTRMPSTDAQANQTLNSEAQQALSGAASVPQGLRQAALQAAREAARKANEKQKRMLQMKAPHYLPELEEAEQPKKTQKYVPVSWLETVSEPIEMNEVPQAVQEAASMTESSESVEMSEKEILYRIKQLEEEMLELEATQKSHDVKEGLFDKLKKSVEEQGHSKKINKMINHDIKPTTDAVKSQEMPTTTNESAKKSDNPKVNEKQKEARAEHANEPKAHLKEPEGKRLKKPNIPPLKVRKCCQPKPTIKWPDIKYMHTSAMRSYRKPTPSAPSSNGIIDTRLFNLPKSPLHSHYIKLSGHESGNNHLAAKVNLLQKALHATQSFMKYLKK